MNFLGFDKERYKKIAKIISKHVIVSLICGTTEYLLFLFLYVKIENELYISYMFAYITATTFGYFLHNFFTYKHNQVTQKTTIYFIVQSLITLCIGYTIVKTLLYINVSPRIAKAIQLVATFGFNVTFGRYVTFNNALKGKK